jgi:hypothetical protein
MDKLPQAWVEFLGTSQSGHTAVAAALDAHPNIIISEEKRYVRKVVQHKWTTQQLVDDCIKYCESFRANTGSHRRQDVPIKSPWNGTWNEKLLVAGNKMGWQITANRAKGRDWFTPFVKRMDIPVKFIHVVRNPYDVLGSWSRKRGSTFEGNFDRLEKETLAAHDIRNKLNSDKYRCVYIEQFCANPKQELRHLGLFLDVFEDTQWQLDCASAIFSKPRRQRQNINWTFGQTDQVGRLINRVDFLRGYSLHG